MIFHNATGTKPHHFNFVKSQSPGYAHVIYLNDPNREWYQNGVPGFSRSITETVSLLRDWADALGATEIITIGSSMGGYGALLHGLALDARICAFGAETVLGLPYSRSQKMMPQGCAHVVPDLTGQMASHGQPIMMILGEEDPTDVYCASLVSAFPHVQTLSFQATDHAVARYLLNKGVLEDILRHVIRGSALPDMPACGRSPFMPEFAALQHRAYHQFAESDFSVAVETFRQALLLNPLSGYCLKMLGNGLIKLGQNEQALDVAFKLAALFPDNDEAEFHVARGLRMCGYAAQAENLLLRMTERHPGFSKAYYDLGLIYLAAKQPDKARDHFAKALAAEPGNAAYAARVEKMKG